MLQHSQIRLVYVRCMLYCSCMVTRSMLTELANKLYCYSFINAVKQFCGCRSLPDLILIDTVTYFTVVANYLKDLINDKKVNYLMKRDVSGNLHLPELPDLELFGKMYRYS